MIIINKDIINNNINIIDNFNMMVRDLAFAASAKVKLSGRLLPIDVRNVLRW